MPPPKKYRRNNEETRIRDKLIRPGLEGLGWLVEVMHCSQYQKGVPDLYLSHPKHGTRWVDVKVAGKYEFTKAQRDKWPRWRKYGTGVWIMTDWNSVQYELLFDTPNFIKFWKPKYGDPLKEFDIEDILGDLDEA